MQDDLFSSPLSSDQLNIEKQRVDELTKQLEKHNQLYYQEASPKISDAEYDDLMGELKKLEATHPELASPNSPTQRVGGAPLEHFEQIEHLTPMLSIEDIHELKPEELDELKKTKPNAVQSENLRDWFTRLLANTGNQQISVSIEPKIDGVAVSAVYKNGVFSYAVTRGDGAIGDDISKNVRTIKSIPLHLPQGAPDLFEVRGEIFMPNKAFNILNKKRDEAGDTIFANPRNATAGTLKQLDSKLVASRPLDCVFHSYGMVKNPPYNTIKKFQATLHSYQLKATPWLREASTVDELLAAIHDLDHDRHQLPYATDGAVIKVNDISKHTSIGTTSKHPKWACAYKFLPEQVETIIKDITIQVGRTGVLTPVAELNPVLVSGTIVSRATLHNQDEIDRKDIRLNDSVIIEKAGEIIPAVVKVLTEKRQIETIPFSLYDFVKGVCPSCSAPIEQAEGFVAWRCVNFACPAQAVTRIKHFASRKALDIDGLGTAVAEKLVETKMISTTLDLFELDPNTLAHLLLDPANLELGQSKPRRLGEKRAEQIITSLSAARKAPLSRWIYAMGIPNIGESASREIARLHKNLFDVSQSEILQNLANLPNYEALSVSKRKKENHPHLAKFQITSELGIIAAQKIIHFFSSSAGMHVLEQLSKLNIEPESDNYDPEKSQNNSKDSQIAGKTFVITGTLTKPRPEFKKLVEQAGGKVSGSISSKTDYLLAGEKAGSKKTKAEKLNVKILDEESFNSMLE